MIRGDVNQLQQCLMNLIFNAIEAMPNGGELSTILSLDRAERLVQLEIKDTGCGIRAEDLDHIFDPFFTTKREGEGTGLGLSIVHGVVKTHGGDIRVKSEAGKGSAFFLHFPSPY
jgi:two-component system NtrC family sensor kinase